MPNVTAMMERKPMPGLFLIAGIAVVMLLGSYRHTKQLKDELLKKVPTTQYLPKTISMLLLTAQVSELLKMIENTTIVTVSAALLLLAIVAATRSGTNPTDE